MSFDKGNSHNEKLRVYLGIARNPQVAQHQNQKSRGKDGIGHRALEVPVFLYFKKWQKIRKVALGHLHPQFPCSPFRDEFTPFANLDVVAEVEKYFKCKMVSSVAGGDRLYLYL